MSWFSKLMAEEAKALQKKLLLKLVKTKLAEQNIENSQLAERFCDQIISGVDGVVSLHHDDSDNREISIAISEDDFAEISRNLDQFLDERVPEIFEDALSRGTEGILRDVSTAWPSTRIAKINDDRAFKDRLELRWSKGLNPLRMLHFAVQDIGANFAARLRRSKAKSGLVERSALLALHVRACQVTAEILCLLENGYGDGAYARWRTLYEIVVVAQVINRYGDDIAQRYFEHETVSYYDELKNDFKHRRVDFDVNALTGENAELATQYKEKLHKFGLPFAGPYGWAAHHLGVKKPTFQNLEAAANLSEVPPQFKLSSYKIHAGVMGLTQSLGVRGMQPLILSGASNAGLEHAAVNTAFSILHITSLIIGRFSAFENQVQLRALLKLRDRVEEGCRRAAKKLATEDAKHTTQSLFRSGRQSIANSRLRSKSLTEKKVGNINKF